MTTDILQAYADNNSKNLYVHFPAGTFSKNALKDDTHFNPFGAFEISKYVIMGLKKTKSPIISNLRNDGKILILNSLIIGKILFGFLLLLLTLLNLMVVNEKKIISLY